MHDEFPFSDADSEAVKVAIAIARRLLAHKSLTPAQIVGIGRALYALEKMPSSTPGADCEIEIVYRAGDENFEEMRYVKFFREEVFKISIGGSTYDRAVGGDSFSEPGWYLDLDGGARRDVDLVELEDSAIEYLNLGAKVIVSDKSSFDIRDVT